MITSKNGNSNHKGDFKYIYLFTNAQLRKKFSIENGDISTCRGCTRKPCSAVSKNICNIAFHMGLLQKFPFLYRPHISNVIH